MDWGYEIEFFFKALGISLMIPLAGAVRMWCRWVWRNSLSGGPKIGSDGFWMDLQWRVNRLHWLAWFAIVVFVALYLWRFVAGEAPPVFGM